VESPLIVALLTLIAIAATAQAVCLIVLLRQGRRVAIRLEEVESELRPRLARASQVVEDVAELTQGAARQLPEIESAVRHAATGVRRAGDLVDLAVLPFRPIARAVAVWHGLSYGVGVYRRLRAPRV
jgi:C4-dicarboxylate-specific signal transduction histidine kinase